MKQTFAIRGMHCTSCAMAIDGALEDLRGVEEATTSFARGRTEVTFDPAQTTLETIISVIREEGYEAQPQ